MYVYCLFEKVKYESSTLLGVYATESLAQDRAAFHYAQAHYDDVSFVVERYSLEGLEEIQGA